MTAKMPSDNEEGPRSTRSRANAPARLSEGEAAKKKGKTQVYRLLKKSDIKKGLVGEEVYVLWPDNGTWYKATFEDISVKAQTASLFYEETEEEETANLAELIEEGQIAFLEERPADHVCSKDEIGLDEKYFGRQPGEGVAAKGGQSAEKGGGEQEVSEEEEDAGAAAADSSDPSFSSAEVKGRKGRRRGRRGKGGEGDSGDESDDESSEDEDEVKLEDFEKRELLKDMSEDEKPLYTRMSEAERKQRRQAAAQKRAAAAAVGSRPPATPKGTGGARAEAEAAAEAALPSPRSAGEGWAGAGLAAGERPRRRAAAGVAAATQALAAAAGVRLEPTSPREVVDEEAAAERYAQSLLAKVTTQRSVDKGSFYGGRQWSGGLDKRGSGVAAISEDDVREKVRARFKQALELVEKEQAWEDMPVPAVGSEGEGNKPDPGAVAAAVEEALMTLCGGVSKEYKSKCQSLTFNLKDPHNPDLRARVMRGQLPPDRLVRMTATELASRELAEYRKLKEQESLKMSVLDAEAAARFSTAAALDARDRLALPADLLADKLLSARERGPGADGGGRGRGERSPSPLPGVPGGRWDGGGAGAGGGAGTGVVETPRAAGVVETPRAPAGVAAAGAPGGEAAALPTTIGVGGSGAELATVAEDEGAEGPSTYTFSEVAGGPSPSPRARAPPLAGGGRAEGSHEVAAGAAAEEAYDPELGLADEDLQGGPAEGLVPPPPPPGSPPHAPLPAGPGAAGAGAGGPGGIDWASIKAKALQESASAVATAPIDALPKLDPLAPSLLAPASASEGSEGHKRERTSPHHHQQQQHHSLPHHASGGGAVPSSRDVPPSPPSGEPPSPGSLAHLVLPQPDPRALGQGVWEGQFLIPGAGAFLLMADALAGSGDVAAMLGEQEIELKGRVPIGKLDAFLVDLRRSRSRTVTLGLLRPTPDATPDERAIFKDVVQQYADRQRTGFGEVRTYPGAGGAPERVEVYVVPGGELARRVLRASRCAAPAAVEAALPGGQSDIEAGQLLLLLIHKRDWRDWFNPRDISRPVKRPRTHPPPQLAPAVPPAVLPSLPQLPLGPGPTAAADPRAAVTAGPAKAGGSGAAQAPLQPEAGAPALPNIDWAALSALTASLGTVPVAAGQQGPPQSAPAVPAPALPAPAAPPELPPLGQFGWVTSQPQPGMGMLPPTGLQPPPAQPSGSAPPPALPFDPAALQLLQQGLQQVQQAQQQQGGGDADALAQGAGGRKRKSRWEVEGGQESGRGEAGGGSGPALATPGPMRREAPGGQGQAPPTFRQQQQQPGGGAPLEQPPPGYQQPPPQQQLFPGQLPPPPPPPQQQFPGQQQPTAQGGPPQRPQVFMADPRMAPPQPLAPHHYQQPPPQGLGMGPPPQPQSGPPGQSPQFVFLQSQPQKPHDPAAGYGAPPQHLVQQPMGFAPAGGHPGAVHQPPPHEPHYYPPHQDHRGGGRGGYQGGRGRGRGPPAGGRRGGGRQRAPGVL